MLSFPIGGYFLGDIVVSLDTVARQSQKLKCSVRDRTFFLIIHGLLHLLGYDHVREADWKKMRRMEEKLLHA